jgi:hypothetical protein
MSEEPINYPSNNDIELVGEEHERYLMIARSHGVQTGHQARTPSEPALSAGDHRRAYGVNCGRRWKTGRLVQ